mmetsp:Transcript_33783/g.85407  ORF Transcript_33783/g.85407 Transcript_33783/m.85407 type:complete len:103 (-) Transcript_33783:2141-2449(-)
MRQTKLAGEKDTELADTAKVPAAVEHSCKRCAFSLLFSSDRYKNAALHPGLGSTSKIKTGSTVLDPSDELLTKAKAKKPPLGAAEGSVLSNSEAAKTAPSSS